MRSGQGMGWTYLISFCGGLASTFLVVVGGIELLERFAPQHLPPPAISNRIDLDEKLVFLRRHPGWQPTILGVGSSITVRSLYGAPFSEGMSPEKRLLNVGIGGAQIHQTRRSGGFYLDLFPEVRTVIQLVVPPDFQDCSTQPATLFDSADAAAYVRGQMSSVRAYLKYFNPHELLAEAWHIASDRETSSGPDGKLFTDEFGSMPMQMSPAQARQRHKELYSEIRALDPKCFRELQEWSREVKQRGARLVVVIPPFSPIFLRAVAGAPQFIDEFARNVSAALDGGPALLVDERSLALGDEAFADAYHLLWPGARVFSRHVSAEIRQLLAGRTKLPTVRGLKQNQAGSDLALGWNDG